MWTIVRVSLSRKGTKPRRRRRNSFKILQADPFPEGALLYRRKVGELSRHCGNRALLFEHHGDLQHSLAVPLECAGIAFGKGQLHLQSREIEQARLDVVGLDLARQSGDLVCRISTSDAVSSSHDFLCRKRSTASRCIRTMKFSGFIAAT